MLQKEKEVMTCPSELKLAGQGVLSLLLNILVCVNGKEGSKEDVYLFSKV